MVTRSLTDQYLEKRKYIREYSVDIIVNLDGKDDDYQEFFKKRDEPHIWSVNKKKIEDRFDDIRLKIRSLDDLTNELPRFGGESEKQKEIDKLTMQLRAALQKCNMEIKQFASGPVKSEQKVIRQNIQANLAYQFEQLSVAFNRTQQEHSENLSSLQKKGLQFLEDDDDNDNEDEHLVSSSSAELQLDNRYARERLKEIKKIARSVQEIKMMFIEISDMVTTQGTVLDRIDQNLTQADIEIVQGVENLVTTETKENQYTKCWLAFLVVLVVFSIVIVLVIRSKRMG
jgi:t-SNARE complex subunit (syntaxin)